MSIVPLLDLLINQVMEEDTWVRNAMDYYDSCKRIVTIKPDIFDIKWRTFEDEVYIGNDQKKHVQTVEKILGEIKYSYTKSGYRPLHAYYDDNKKVLVPTDRVCYLWAEIVKERMANKMQDCRFDDVAIGDKETALFTYTVPALSFKDWF